MRREDREIAALLGGKRNTVTRARLRALAKLRAALGERGGEEED